MTKWAILLAIVAVIEFTFGLYIWSYKPPLPSEAMFDSREPLQQLSPDAVSDLIETRGPKPTPRDVFVSYATAIYLKEYGIAYDLLSMGVKADYEPVGGSARFAEEKSDGFTYFDLGRVITILQTETEAFISAPLLGEPASMGFWLVLEGREWRIDLRRDKGF